MKEKEKPEGENKKEKKKSRSSFLIRDSSTFFYVYWIQGRRGVFYIRRELFFSKGKFFEVSNGEVIHLAFSGCPKKLFWPVLKGGRHNCFSGCHEELRPSWPNDILFCKKISCKSPKKKNTWRNVY